MDRQLRASLGSLGGIARRAELLRRGVLPEQIDAAWRSGEIARIRHGVYGRPDLPEAVVRAARVGGVLAASSATPSLDLWQPPGASLHVSVRENAKGLRDPDSADRPLDRENHRVRILRDGARLDRRRERLHVGLRSCLRQVVTLEPPAFGLAVLDSALRRHGLAREQLALLCAELPARCQVVVERASPTAESGTESVLRWGLLEAGLRFESQKWISDGIRVDFLVAGRVVIECTSFEFHGSARDYERDRARIATAVRLGYTVLEFTYHQVLFEWPMVLDTILCAVLRG
ncbi:hypothetical protein GCM10025867_12870 [Frondihabitans sucicola]|uniref:DUF559 domain-containing protein n=1 Tax=Frondihabitans sucicola TaxID=1268041 RepID=A0ABM8GKY1_9MICO|nr:type IV toxin-antitoxin system AbiEi family antitoxin domain-containing protein [Frondihabitans sucicola]BDZ49046.1 hypothetical protein GCM10025867_12870 [Frondihabitans sucicola]